MLAWTGLRELLLIVRGQAAHEVEEAYTRARVLCQQLGDTQEVFPVLFGLWRFYVVRGDFAVARELGEELLDRAERRDEMLISFIAHYALGVTYLWIGELRLAHSHIEEGMAHYTPAQRRSPLFRAGQDPGVGCHGIAARTLWLLGYADQALARAHDMLALATELDDPFTYVFALDNASEEGLTQICQGLTDWRATGAELLVPYFLTLLAEGYGNLKQFDEGLEALNEGLEMMERTGEHWWKAEVYRLQGELLLRQATPDVAQAESCFQQALDVS